MSSLGKRIFNLAVAIDQLVYVLMTMGAGHPDETLSAAAWRTEQTGKLGGRIFRPVIDLIFLPLEREHCRKAYEAERLGQQLPPEYRA